MRRGRGAERDHVQAEAGIGPRTWKTVCSTGRCKEPPCGLRGSRALLSGGSEVRETSLLPGSPLSCHCQCSLVRYTEECGTGWRESANNRDPTPLPLRHRGRAAKTPCSWPGERGHTPTQRGHGHRSQHPPQRREGGFPKSAVLPCLKDFHPCPADLNRGCCPLMSLGPSS